MGLEVPQDQGLAPGDEIRIYIGLFGMLKAGA